MAAGGTASNVTLGPGRLYYAPVGTAEPASASSAVPSAWLPVGYTEEGTEFSAEITSEAIEVAEEFDPIAYRATSRRTSITFQMVEATISKLALALGAGATRVDNAVTFEFPDPSAVVDVMFLWDSDETPTTNQNRRWLFRQARPSGTVSLANRKAPAKRGLPITFDCAKPSSAASAVKVYPNASGQV
jgi:hypothetical protein